MKLNLKKFSVLSLALLATSAVVSAFIPAKKDVKFQQNGIVTQAGTDDATGTCVAADVDQNCHQTATAGVSGGTSSDGGTTVNSTEGKNTTLNDNA